MALREPGDEIIGKWVRIKSCEARDHGDPEGCVCELVGKEVKVSRKYKTWFAGTPSYHLRGRTQRVRRSEVVLIQNQPTITSRVGRMLKRVVGRKKVERKSQTYKVATE